MVVDAASHSIIDPGSKADIRPAYQPPLPSPRHPPTLITPRRSLVPATRGLRWDQPFESSSIIELDTEPRRGVRRTLIHLLLSHIPRHCRLSCTSIYSLALYLLAHPRHELSRLSYRGFFKTTCAPDRRILHLSFGSPFILFFLSSLY